MIRTNPALGGLRSIGELAANKPHGNRIRYMSGCRCTPCRAANSRYETDRSAARKRGEWNGIVSAEPVREHLTLLSSRGIGRDTVADIAGIAPSTIDLLRTGKRTGLRAMNEKAILAIDPDTLANDAQLIPARETWQRIRWLLKNGFTKREIARRLGYRSPALQLNKTSVTSRNALKIERLYNIVRFKNPRHGEMREFSSVGAGAYIALCLKCEMPQCDETDPRCLIQIERRKAA